VGAPDQPNWDPELAQRFKELLQSEADLIYGIER
jgi:hypothetical protein